MRAIEWKQQKFGLIQSLGGQIIFQQYILILDALVFYKYYNFILKIKIEFLTKHL